MKTEGNKKQRRDTKKQRLQREKGLAALLLAPTLIVFSIFMFWPLIRTVELSFYKWNMSSPDKKFVGLDNYLKVLTSPVIGKVLANTLWYILLFILIDFVLPYLISYLLSFVIKKGNAFYKTSLFMPSLISLVVGAIIMSWIFNPLSGPLASIGKSFGIEFPVWSQTSGLVIVVLSLITSWKIFGYNIIVLLAGVASVPMELIETARLEKTPNWQIFLKIVVPMSASTGIYVLLITVVWGLQWVYTPINVITQGGPNNGSSNIIYAVYKEAFNVFQTGSASALAILTMLFFGLLLFLEIRFVEKGIYYEN
ncbi:carbohydrate ABC transporter permease [Diplocloster modestus]|uniref:Sugar ABC transporter permease n=1 Tax=Diplocloster modestus TaxID=2850322 RepID=A0ABS6K4Q4_9FIRM|nr:sugar ABC transporter permease [Diplocloster modestus]MBU9725526.1 sugar ABC transporter permease [Diplocloster modestus]